uniref:Zinc/iron permease n=1 Tax=Clastoptera arizonana TaxID=38151 RepID=A0A1B6CZX6_9HEMI
MALGQLVASSEDTVSAKIISMLLLGLSSLVMILLPIFLSKSINKANTESKHGSKVEYVLSLLLSFGGGVLLSTVFLHLLPEVKEGVESLTSQGKLPAEPPVALPELIMCIGFFTMLIVEELIHTYLDSRTQKRHPKKFDIEMDPEVTIMDCTDLNKGLSNSSAKITLIDSELIPPGEGFDSERRASFMQTNIDTTFPPVNDDKVFDETINITHYKKNYGPNKEASHHEDHSHFGHQHIPTSEDPILFRELLIVIALTVHEVFEGLAIGLETHLESVWYLLTAVAVHKSVIAFCIGVEMVSASTRILLAIVYALIFAVASPIGIAMGLFLEGQQNIMDVLSVFLQGMATGTLLYVVFFEVLKRKPGRKAGLNQMLCIVVGFITMATLQAVLA